MIDQFGRNINYMRISVTDLCNQRCRYCMPEEGVCKRKHEEMLSEDELITAVSAAASLGITKVRLTGGEPLVKRGILSRCDRIRRIDGIRELALTTNGILLPGMAGDLKKAGVTRLNISLDTLDPDKYAYITRREHFHEAYAGIETALQTGFEKIKLNAVLIGGFNDDEIADLANLTYKWPVDMRFIEMMPMYDSGDFGPEAYIPCQRVLETLEERYGKVIPAGSSGAHGDCADHMTGIEELPSDGGVAKLYHLPGAKGNIGLISPVSAHFCGSCSRIRLTADGKIKPCLHREAEYSLKGLDEEAMKEQIREAILAKPLWHGDLDMEHRSHAGRNMNEIGG